MNFLKTYKIFNSSSVIELDGIPELWGMLGPLPDNVIDYIRKNQGLVVDYDTGELIMDNQNKPYIRPIKGKNKNEWYFFSERTKNWYTANYRFQGKAVILTPEDWNVLFSK